MVWTEQDAKDARRLIGVMDERAKRKTLAGGVGLEPAEIHDPEKGPADEPNQGVSLTQSAGQITAAKGC